MPQEEYVQLRPLIVEMLLTQSRLKPESIKELDKLQKQQNFTIEEALVEHGSASADEIAALYASYFSLPPIDLESHLVQLEQLKELLPEKMMRDWRAIPVLSDEQNLVVAVADPTRLWLPSAIEVFTGFNVELRIAPIHQITQALGRLFGARDVMTEIAREIKDGEGGVEGVEGTEEDEEDNATTLNLDKEVESGPEARAIRVTNELVRSAIQDGASDIHLEPTREELRVRFRIDGMLRDVAPIPKASAVPMLSRLKILAKMDIAEKRLPQDGAIRLILKGKQIDLRVNTVPAIWGEKMVARILNRDAQVLTHKSLGFNDRQFADFAEAAHSSHGLIFVTGPTGSGKSTTLYATLELIKSPTLNISTVEDPVEYKMPGINQIQVKTAIGLTFASVLRAFLRQDPDVILVGEVRDQETAQICLRAALTGHLVLSTIHTNSALVTVSRLADLGMEPFMMSSSLRLVEAQRLVRRLCPKCKQPYEVDQQLIDKSGFQPGTVIYRPRGCETCHGLGYKGRVGIYEVVRVTPELADLIRDSAPVSDMEKVASSNGTMFIAQHGLERVARGDTSIEEVFRVSTGEE